MTAGSQPAPAAHPPRRISVYVDGFNLYYGSLKGTPYKWLDPYALACALLPSDRVTAVHYFTARVKPTPRNGRTTPLWGERGHLSHLTVVYAVRRQEVAHDPRRPGAEAAT